MSSSFKNLITVLGGLIVIVFGYYLYTQNSSLNLSTNNTVAVSDAAAQSSEFLRRLTQLQAIDLDDSLFSDPAFQSLVDNRKPLIEGSIGRTNPFLTVE